MKLNRNTSSSLLKLISLVYREHRDKFGGQQYQPKKKPYMRYREIEVVEEILYNLQPTSCLEWGAGSSTLFFPPKLHRKLDGFRSSINSDGWKGFKTFNQVLLSAFITYRRINCPGPMKCKMGLMPILLTTLNTPSNLLPMILSWLMVVRATTASKKRLVLSNQKGVVVLHDANRKSYHASFERYSNQVLFRGYRPHAGGIWIGSRGISISEVLDVERHQAVWRLCRIVGKVFRC